MSKLTQNDLLRALEFWKSRGQTILVALALDSSDLKINLENKDYLECKREIERLTKLQNGL